MGIDKLKLAVFISGRGSNLKAILDACAAPKFPAQIRCIVSNKAEAGGLEYAREHNIPYAVISHKDYASKQDFEQALLDALSHEPIDLICLAGFMRILSPYFLERWGDSIINIHPSLLPKYKGLDTHKRAIEAGDKEAGCTIHYVIPEMDAGKIIYQKKVPIVKQDTEDTLAQKVIIEEHRAYPHAIRLVVEESFSNLSTSTPHSTVTDLAPEERAHAMWDRFSCVMSYTVISMAVLLMLMALFLL